MNIQSISISNVLSFKKNIYPFQEPHISFTPELNIIIGPNGAGKTNFGQILNVVLSRLIRKSWKFEEARLKRKEISQDSHRNALQTEQNLPAPNIGCYRDFYTDKMEIEILLNLNENDRANLKFLVNHKKEINDILKKYSWRSDFDPLVNLNEIESLDKYKIYLTGKGSLEWQKQLNSPLEVLVQNYLEDYELFRYIIYISNKYFKTDWPELKNTFVILPSTRGFNYFNKSYALEREEQDGLQNVEKKIKEQDIRSIESAEPPMMEIVKKKLAFLYTKLYETGGKQHAKTQILNTLLLSSLNRLLTMPSLELKMTIDREDPNSLEHSLLFQDLKSNREVEISQLSAGQKSMLLCIFSIYGHDLENGLLIIDEPELHLHPQAQESFFEIIKQASKEQKIQTILITHSSIFINAESIHNVFRFYMEGEGTKVINPQIQSSEKELLKIINLTNTNKIFFARKVILVEGEADELFFRFLLKEEFRNNETAGLEVINIKGKGSYQTWLNFLNKFHIPHAFIGDWDNVVDFGIITQQEIDNVQQTIGNIAVKLNNEFNKKNSQDKQGWLEITEKVINNPSEDNLRELESIRNHIIRRHIPYKQIIEHIKNSDVNRYTQIVDQISLLSEKDIFLLTGGELEDYLCIKKGTDSLFHFLQTDYKKWKENNPKASKEILSIVEKIKK